MTKMKLAQIEPDDKYTFHKCYNCGARDNNHHDNAFKAMLSECPTVEVLEAQKVQEEFDDFCIKKFGSGMSIRDRFILKKFFKQSGYKIIKEASDE